MDHAGIRSRDECGGGYRRAFAVPADWIGKRVKLRCEGVYSEAAVWINGKEVGRHAGGFTPFELDVTDLVRAGPQNVIALSVVNETEADRMASGSKYACHALGGITRGIRLFVLPDVNIASLAVATAFDAGFRDASLNLALGVMNESGTARTGLGRARADRARRAFGSTRSDLHRYRNRRGRRSVDERRLDPRFQSSEWDNEHPASTRSPSGLKPAGRSWKRSCSGWDSVRSRFGATGCS
jgi:hypothetical protein